MKPPNANSVIGITSSLSNLIVENFLSLNRVTGSENCRIAGICGQYHDDIFIPELVGKDFQDLVDQNDLFLIISINQAKDLYVISGWSDKDFNKTATQPITYIETRNGIIIPISSINPRMELFIDRIIN
jgi:hypothetical protein